VGEHSKPHAVSFPQRLSTSAIASISSPYPPYEVWKVGQQKGSGDRALNRHPQVVCVIKTLGRAVDPSNKYQQTK